VRGGVLHVAATCTAVVGLLDVGTDVNCMDRIRSVDRGDLPD
jgi:hypothetical protein